MPDVIVVLARGIGQDGRLSSDSRARVRTAMSLYEQGLAPRILMSGAWWYKLPEPPPQTEAAAMSAYAVDLGVPARAILQEDRSMDTIGNAYYTKVTFCLPNAWRDLVVVASDDQMERVRSIFTTVFGPDYVLRFIESVPVLDADARRRAVDEERGLHRALTTTMAHVRDGDHAAVREVLLRTISAYHHRNLP